MRFRNRAEAGRRLSELLLPLRGEEVVVLGLPRGGVPVAYEVARALHAPLDVIMVRKLGVPYQPELAMGAIGEDGVRVVNDEVVRMTGVGEGDLAAAERREREVLAARARRFRPASGRIDLTGRTALVVDDGIATGSTARAACHVARAHGASRVVLAAPVAAPRTVEELRDDADEVICLDTPEWFFGIGQFYADFSQVPDEDVAALLERSRTAGVALEPDGERVAEPVEGDPAPAEGLLSLDVDVVVGDGRTRLGGHLAVPGGATGLVVFAHGSGSSRHSPRNRYVAHVLEEAGLATLLFDLLTPDEELLRTNVFDVDLLAGRLLDATRWARDQAWCRGMSVGYFGASTGAAAALRAAADPGAEVAAVVSRGGRPDLAGGSLAEVRAPTLLIVGGLDEAVLALNRRSDEALHCVHRLEVVPGATHLFEEAGTLQRAAELARDWFVANLERGGGGSGP